MIKPSFIICYASRHLHESAWLSMYVTQSTCITHVRWFAGGTLTLATPSPSSTLHAYHWDGDNFSASLLHLLQAVHKVPELWLCLNIVRSEDPHPVQLRIPDLFRWYSPPDDLKLLQLQGQIMAHIRSSSYADHCTHDLCECGQRSCSLKLSTYIALGPHACSCLHVVWYE